MDREFEKSSFARRFSEDSAKADDSSPFEKRQSWDEIPKQRLVTRSMSQAEFICSVCYEIMVEPTTLNCGHSFCRSCLAGWVLSSNNFNCPACRQPFKGHPKVNIIIRSTIMKLFGEIIAERAENTRTDPHTQQQIAEFDRKVEQSMKNNDGRGYRAAVGMGFWKGVGFALIIMTVIWLVWCWRTYDSDLLVQKPIHKWSTQDVEQWLRELGPWTEEDLISTFKKEKIDGHLLLAINEDDLPNRFNITNSLHIRAFMGDLQRAQLLGAKPPRTLWEYKTLHPGWTLFLLCGLKDYPRLTILYTYFMDYTDIFLPFIHCTSPAFDLTGISLYSALLPDPTRSQWIDFLAQFLMLPYWMIAKFCWEWLDVHYWVSRIVLINCCLLSLLEANSLIKWNRNWKALPSLITGYFKGLTGYILWVILWPLIPSFVCDCFFHVTLCLSVINHCERIYKAFRRQPT